MRIQRSWGFRDFGRWVVENASKPIKGSIPKPDPFHDYLETEVWDKDSDFGGMSDIRFIRYECVRCGRYLHCMKYTEVGCRFTQWLSSVGPAVCISDEEVQVNGD